ncbi:MAG TPA: sigma 54-interacting transcriptional regulator [Blastocatellia bacterium]|jgi:DNA-binding NtrC family response regulator|nr:sigma 54-interacting transcriptional regulator [Blastocatellia bacterium]
MQVAESIISDRLLGTSSIQPNHSSFLQERVIGASRWAAEARTRLAAHAAHDNTVILEGEPGTGREFLARMIHKCSARSKGPFVAISFDSVSDESAEAALFGSVRSLPTGPRLIHPGLVESAEGGIVYIADASKLSFSLRANISRLIQYNEFRRSGDVSVQRSNVRIMLGSTSRLDAGLGKEWSLVRTEVRVGDVLFVPPLRERPEDIEPLISHFVKQACEQTGREVRQVAPEAMAVMRRHLWPGNVAELRGMVEQMVQRCAPPMIGLSHLPAHIADSPESVQYGLPPSGLDLINEVRKYEMAILCAALKQCHGVQKKTATLLGLKPTTLNMKLKAYEIDASAYK